MQMFHCPIITICWNSFLKILNLTKANYESKNNEAKSYLHPSSYCNTFFVLIQIYLRVMYQLGASITDSPQIRTAAVRDDRPFFAYEVFLFRLLRVFCGEVGPHQLLQLQITDQILELHLPLPLQLLALVLVPVLVLVLVPVLVLQ